MTRRILIFTYCLLIVSFSYGQKSNHWKESNQKSVEYPKLNFKNNDYKVYDVNEALLKKTLLNSKRNIINFPNADGDIIQFRVEESAIMHPDLASKFPNNKSFRGVAIDGSNSTVRFTVNGLGIHAVIRETGLITYINPISKDDKAYVVFKRDNVINDDSFECQVKESLESIMVKSALKQSSDLKLRTYELALATTGEYSQFHIDQAGMTNGTNAQKIQAVMDAVEVAINRVNEIFERDIAVTLQLIPNTDLLFYLDGTTDPYTNGDGIAMLSENQNNVDNVIGSSSYDIGHVFSTGGGGVATLASPCSGGKARGVTGQPNPVGDPFSVDYVAHELGHQFGANHTFNGTAENCGPNRNDTTAVEPGSGSTIMSYAGLCSPQNVQSLVDDYFNTISIQEMVAFITSSSSNCDEETTLVNNLNAPTANAGSDFTVPKSTPLVLKGQGNDLDGNSLTYCWEQTDNSVVNIDHPPSSSQPQGAVFRSLPPTISSDRYLPDVNTVLAGDLSSTWEVLPSVGRTMDFTLTVRDNVLGGGQTALDEVTITVDNNSGPFMVTSQNTNEVFWAAGSQETITWDVANTNVAPVNSSNVNILLSLDGGITYPIALANNVANNGSHVITVPSNLTSLGRIKVEGANHIFYALNQTNINITNDFAINVVDKLKKVCSPEDGVYDVDLNFASGFNETVTFSADNLPAGATVNFNPSTANSNTVVEMTVSNTQNIDAGSYLITIIGTSNSVSRNYQVELEIFKDAIDIPNLINPSNGSNNVLATGTIFTWADDVNVENYVIEISNNSNFTDIIESASVNTNSYEPINLVDATTYYWRVRPSNICGSGDFSEVFIFTTSEIVCDSYSASNLPLDIPDDNTTGVNSVLTISEGVVINDVNVSIDINHTWLRDLIITLTSPSGTEVTLLERQCRGNSGNINMSAIFDDEGTLLACANSSPVITGTINATELLSQFDGETSQGNWTLTITDVAADDTGSLVNWSIEICESRAVASVDDEIFGNLNIWPNPTNDIVNVNFTSLNQENTQIKLYDTLGRLILNKEYQVESLVFNETFSIENFSSGLYFIEISKGKNTTTKRLIKL